MKLVVSVPTNGMMCSETCLSLINALHVGKLEGIWTVFPRGCFVHQGRNDAVEAVVDSDFTHILFVDGDMMFQPDSIAKLASRHKDIIGAAYNVRNAIPSKSTVMWEGKGDMPARDIFLCSGLGLGFTLIKLDVFRRMPKPWFWFELTEGNAFMGEDYYFCKKVRELGYKIWCDPTVDIKHIGTQYY